MKYNFFYLVVVFVTMVFTSCESSRLDNDEPSTRKITTYSIVNNIDIDQMREENKGINIVENILVLEYNDKNERVVLKDINNVRYGDDYKFEASKNTEKVTVQIEIKMSKSGKESSLVFWMAQVNYLEKGAHTEIILTDDMRVSMSNPIQ